METKQLPQFVDIVIDGVDQYQIQKTNEIKDKINNEIPKEVISYVNEHESELKELQNFGVDIDEIEILKSLDLLSIKDFLELKTKICSSREIYKDLYPLNARVITLLILTQTLDLPSYSEKDFKAECIYYADQKEYQKIITDIWKGQAALNNLGLENFFDYDFEVFEELSNIIKSVVSELEKLHTNPIKILKGIGMDDKIIELFLSGKQEDWEIFKKLDIELPENISLKNLLAITIFIQLYHKLKSNEIEIPNNLIPDDIQEVTISYSIFDKVYQIEKEKHPADYNIWKNYIDDNWIIGSEIKDIKVGLLYTLTMIDGCYTDILNIYFDIIYNNNYSEAYRADVIKILKNEEYAAILPYYGEYCKKHNISPDKYYYLGDISEKHEEISSLSNINEKSDESEGTDINRLSMPQNFNNSKIDKLSRLLAASGLIEAKEREYLSYFLGSGNTALKKSEPITWLGTRYSLKYFIDKLYYNGKQSNRWKSVANIFKVSTQGTYKKLAYLSYTNLSKNDYEQKVDEKTKKLIDECIDKALNSTT